MQSHKVRAKHVRESLEDIFLKAVVHIGVCELFYHAGKSGRIDMLDYSLRKAILLPPTGSESIGLTASLGVLGVSFQHLSL